MPKITHKLIKTLVEQVNYQIFKYNPKYTIQSDYTSIYGGWRFSLKNTEGTEILSSTLKRMTTREAYYFLRGMLLTKKIEAKIASLEDNNVTVMWF